MLINQTGSVRARQKFKVLTDELIKRSAVCCTFVNSDGDQKITGKSNAKLENLLPGNPVETIEYRLIVMQHFAISTTRKTSFQFMHMTS